MGQRPCRSGRKTFDTIRAPQCRSRLIGRPDTRGSDRCLQSKTKLPTLANIKATLFILQIKITNNMKYHLTSQLTDPRLREHIMLKEEWSEHTFGKVDWPAFETAFKRLSKNRQRAVSKSCHNLWHTGKRNGQIYRGKKSCCFCNKEEEDWNHVLS
jgi:hypothetical protein